MICPNCHQFTPDQNYKCSQCGAVTATKGQLYDPERVSPLRKNEPRFLKPWMAVVAALLVFLGYLAFTRLNRSDAANALDPGEELTIGDYLQKGKTNIVDFYSNYCPPCKKISPLLRELGRKRPDLAILPVDINRKGVKGIDWASPLARQFELRSIPHFKIYDGDGNLLKEGPEAWPEILTMLATAGISM